MVTAVVMAAGASTRMGTHKLLLPFGGEPLLRRVVREVSLAGFDDLLVVLGCEHDRTMAALNGIRCRSVINADYEAGMGTSFRAAVSRLGASAAAMFALADQPFVMAEHYRTVLTTFREHVPGIVCVQYGGVTAPPHLFDRRFFPELETLQHGARPVLDRHRDETVIVRFPPELLVDIDTPEDYERALATLARDSPH